AWVAQDHERQDEQAGEEEDEHRPLPPPEVPADGDPDEEYGGDRDDDERLEAEVLAGQADAHELGADGQKVQQEDAAGGEPSPAAPEALADELGVADPGHRPEAHDHLLVDDQHGDEEEQGPQKRVTEVLARLRIG